MLAGSLLGDRERGYEDGFFVFLYPSGNESCARAVEMYAACLAARTSFVPCTLEALVAAVEAEGGGPWVQVFAERYLGFEKIENLAGPVGR